mmetsp:Transcript_40291/g.126842  ORF Transcript_40291/g.126842 Transcript_40291/m.126842 type:complete len:131 (-) Transcript_40291:108-500(-)
MMDTSSTGHLPVENARRLGRLLGFAIPERHSVNAKGISIHQFQGWVAALSGKTDGGHEALRFFTYMRDKKGFIGKARMREWLKLHKIQCDERELEELMELMNTSDDDRGVSYDDLVSFLEQNKAGGIHRH